MRFGVLGPVTAFGLDGAVELGPTRQRTVLAILLVESGTAVTPEQLVDRVWGERPPQRARETLHSYLSRLRTTLEAAGGPTPARRGRGYLIDADPDAVDLHRFRRLADAARAAGDTEAARLWPEALTLWRGTPFEDLDSDWLRSVAAGLEGERWSAVLDRNDVLLRTGEHTAILAELTLASDDHPLDERVAGQYLLALYAAGRQADALAHYRTLRRRLVDEIGSEPGPALRELHHRILRQDPHLVPGDPETPRERTSVASTVVPAQLPADVAGFTGRAAELDRLDTFLAPETGAPEQAMKIAVIGGTAGVGKTTLAVHWAHRVRARFPDGQLYVNLRGYDPEQPMATGDALARFLTALGLTGHNIPLGEEDRAARFRSEVAGKRMLIVLDNAAGVRQVRALLPGSGSCLVVVTSRDSLAGLVAVDGAYRLDLGLLSVTEAVDLLNRLIGRRAEAEPVATALLAEQCARLSLALRVAAELAVSRPDSTLADLSAELTDRQSRLDLLDPGGDPYAAVREVFSWSTHHLPTAALETFRLLGLHPGPDIDPYAVAALAGVPVDQARRNLAVLARAHLVHRSGPNRYGLHDLLRAYAAGLATREVTGEQREHASRRLLDYYRAAATAAMDCLHPAEAPHRPSRMPSSATIPDLTTPEAAAAWLDAERFCLIAVAAHAAAGGDYAYVVSLTRTVHRYLIDTHLTEAIALSDQARRSAEGTDDPSALAHALRLLGAAYSRMSQVDLALECQLASLAEARRAADPLAETLAYLGLGVALSHLGRGEEAIERTRDAIAVATEAADALGQAIAFNNVAVLEQQHGRYAEAGEHLREALSRFQALDARRFQANALTNLGVIETRLGDLAAAAGHFDASLGILHELSTPIVEAHTLDKLGMLLLRLGDAPAASERFRQAVRLFHQVGVPAAEAGSLNGLGEAAMRQGRLEEALAHHQEALAMAEQTKGLHQQAQAHLGLGRVLHALNEADRARAHLETSLKLYTALRMPEADEVRTTLAELAQP
ncbi:MAG: tetratricopeptide repeat protein [Hamadaea sp.]|nr:tetratricopeptide repeat protein [Hamadaea sp.]